MTSAASEGGPSGLRREEVALLIEELRPTLSGARLEKVFDREDGFVFRFKTPSGKWHLLLTTRAGFSRFHLIEPGVFPARPSDAATDLRQQLTGAVVQDIDQPGGDRLVRISLDTFRPQPRHWQLILELFGRRGRLLLCEGSERRVRFVSGRGGTVVGMEYRFPESPPAAADASPTLPFEPRRQIPDELRDDPHGFHRWLEERLGRAESEARWRQARDVDLRSVRRAAKKLGERLRRLDRDRDGAAQWQQNQRLGELLQGARGQLRRGLSRIEVVDYFDAELATCEIALDPALSPQENVDRYFKRARKGKRGLSRIEDQVQAATAELERLEQARLALEGARDENEYSAAQVRVQKLKLPRKQQQAPPPKKRSGEREARKPRRFRSREGLEMLAGRSAADNDRLTMQLARGNDLFFHRAFQPGPHVIVRVPKGKQASPESIDDAAFLAAYLAGWRGPAVATVHWTEAKNVRKPKGLPPGKVQISRHREYRIEFDADRIATLVWPDEPEEDPPRG